MNGNTWGIIRTPNDITFGEGALDTVPRLVSSLGERVLVCTDAYMASTALFAGMVTGMRDAGTTVMVYGEAKPELPIETIEHARQAAQCFAPQMIVGMGGGSCMDLAKVVALLLTHGGDIRRYYGENNVPGPLLPVIAVPTTAGTGSEVSPVAVITDSERTLKVGISSPHLVPRHAVCDPMLTHTAPASVSAHSGIDALAHAIESTTATVRQSDFQVEQRVFIGRNALATWAGIEAVHAIGGSLEQAVSTPKDADARREMMYGSLLAGIALGTGGTGAAHALQYPLGSLTHTPHGLGVGLLLPYVLQYNRDYCLEPLALIGGALGSGTTDQLESAQFVIERVASLVASIGIPTTIKEIGIKREQIASIAEDTLQVSRLLENNPRPVGKDGLVEILEAAYSGNLNVLQIS